MNICIIGSGNVGGALARVWIKAGHSILIGSRFPLSEKAQSLANEIGIDHFKPIEEAVFSSDIIVLSTPAAQAIEVAQSLGNTEGKIIIDTMNIVMDRGPEGFNNTSDAIKANTQSQRVIK
jgi:predicted dinucleotide-binding enzyme